MRLNIPNFSELSSLASLVAKEIDPSPELISIRVRKNQPVFNFDLFTVKVNMDGNSGNIPLPKDAEIKFFFFGKLDRTEVWGAEKLLRLMEEAKRQKEPKNPR
jgi:hypothetical protein